MENFTPKDAFRVVLIQMLDSVGFDPEVALFRVQATIALIGSPPFTFF